MDTELLNQKKPSPATEKLIAIQRRAKKDFNFAIQVLDPKYLMGAMHKHLCRNLEDVANGKIKRLIINTPPRHGKSRLAAIEFPAWLLGLNPEKKIIAASYSAHLSEKHSKDCMDRLATIRFQSMFPDTRLRVGRLASSDWGTTAGGGYMATGVGGSLTGMGADLLIIDDPLKDFEEAHSPTMREKVWNWFLSTAFTRLHPGASIICIMTRWHTDDLIGRLLDPKRRDEIHEAGGEDEDEKWKLIKLPALAEVEEEGAVDEIGRKHDEALFPEWFPKERLRTVQSVLGPYIWTSLYRQNPVLKGGNYADVSKLKTIRAADLPHSLQWVRYWDLAASEKATADYTASIKAANDEKGNLYLADMQCKRLLWPKARKLICAIAKIEKVRVGIEAVGGFKTAFENLKEDFPKDVQLREYGADQDKLCRALPWFALLDNGKVFLVEGSWNQGFIEELIAFPAVDHDDQIDAVSGAYNMLTGGTATITMQKLIG